MLKGVVRRRFFLSARLRLFEKGEMHAIRFSGLWMGLTAFGLGVLSAKLEQSPAVKAVAEVGGLALPLAGGGWEVEFHHRGRDLLTNDGLARLEALGDVVSLNLRDTGITGEGLVHLKKLGTLQRLHLERTKVDDVGMEHLAGLSQLEYLNLYATSVSDKSLEHFADLKNLRQIYLWQTKVTAGGAEKLQKSLPKLRISRGVDLDKLASQAPKVEEPKATASLKWLPFGGSDKPPNKSKTGTFIKVTFSNQRTQPVKLVWIDYGGGQKLYGEIAPGGKREQTSYSGAVWLVTDPKDQPLGHFVTNQQYATAIIPKD
tara:strand:- start:502 stop:1449 length:948 start_codon:yes stop_codon:yes gene_type:complete